MTEHTLKITYGTSRARDTYGYNTLVTLTDDRVGKRFKASGGGYDMRGTVFGDWLEANFQPVMLALAHADRHDATWTAATGYQTKDRAEHRDALYGMAYYPEGSLSNKAPHVCLDGGCGFAAMQTIAEAAGLSVRVIDAGKRMDVVLVTAL